MGILSPPGRRAHPAYEATDPPPPAPDTDPPASLMVRAARTPLARLLVLIAATATAITGVVTATGAAVVNVISTVAEANARKSNAEISQRIDALEVRVNGRFGLDLEEKARREKDSEIEADLAQVKSDVREIDARVPAKKRR